MNDKKQDTHIVLYSILGVLVLLGCCYIGYVLDVTAYEGQIQVFDALNGITAYLAPNNIPLFFQRLINGNGQARTGLFVGVFAGVIVVMYSLVGNSKRYQKKGIEHGSARWGKQSEKNIIADTTKKGYYNNIIVASDVFLVLNRKRREENELSELSKKERKKREKQRKRIDNAKKKNQSKRDTENLSVKDVVNMQTAGAKIKPMLNLNMMILGGSGTGKSRFFVKPNLLQCNTSYIITDPSGELVQSCGKMLERMGYEIKIFNINDMTHSSNYNPFHYVYDYNGNLDKLKVLKMINTFMMNSKGENQGGGGDPFWDDSTKLLLSAVSFLILETTEDESQRNFAQVLDIIHKMKVIEAKPGQEAPKSEFDLIFEKHREENPNALSVQYYDEFRQAAGKTLQSILISTTTKLQHFKIDKIKNLTHTDNIHLEEIGDKKQALFIIIPSSDKTFNYLAAMMYTQLFDTLYDRAINLYHGKLPVHVRFMLDEFANIGKIPGFEEILATCRKFEISVQVILQSLSQLKQMYEKSWEGIPGNCDTLIYLGGKDQSTNEYLSKDLGKETIDQLSINQTKGKQGSSSYNNAIMGRDLATIDELGVMENNNCIVMIRGLHPFFSNKFDVSNHPRYSMLDECDPENNTYYLENEVNTKEPPESLDFEGDFEGETAEQQAEGINDISITYSINDKAEKSEEVNFDGLETLFENPILNDLTLAQTVA